MDHQFYDLVEEVVSYLPRSDVQTIARVAARSPTLDKWSIASEDQLERRFLLRVSIHLQGCKVEEKKAESLRIRLSVQKLLSEETWEEWDFKDWRYAWIHYVAIEASLLDDPSTLQSEVFQESDMDQVMRVVSLPVDPDARSLLSITNYCFVDDVSPELDDLFWKVVHKTQKDFARVRLWNIDENRVFNDLVADFITRGAFLEELAYEIEYPSQLDFCEAIASVFGKTRGRPINVCFGEVYFEPEGVELIVDAWLQSDGTFEKKAFKSELAYMFDEVWSVVKRKYENVMQRRDPGEYLHTTESVSGYLPHPSKLSSLLISPREISVVKFEPWHVPVDFHWIASLIDKWREGCGFYAWRGERNLFFHFKTDDDWLKLVEKYGSAVDEGTILVITHPISPTVLEVEKMKNWFEIGVKHEFFTLNKMKAFIADWTEGNGETLMKEVTRMEVQSEETAFSLVPKSYRHPLVNARCLLSERGWYANADSDVLRISIAPIDVEDVEDWNLELLFGSLQV
uniref:F-box domain-containing protein n=1 Tax=Steinernema glaseri TaxID=37863 RepID=A0A1I8AFH9_9BILA